MRLGKVRLWLIRMLVGAQPVAANLTVYGTIVLERPEGALWNNCFREYSALPDYRREGTVTYRAVCLEQS